MKYHLRPARLLIFITALVPVSAWAWTQQSGSTIATDRIFEAIGVREGITVCEMGAGDGELSIAAARRVGASGRVFTSELGDDRLGTLRERVTASGLANITVAGGHPSRTNFPDAACDALFMRNVYHHFEDPAAMNQSILAALKPGGKVGIVDFGPPGNEAPRPSDRDNDGMHGVRAESVERELRDAGFEVAAAESASQRWFMVVGTKAARPVY